MHEDEPLNVWCLSPETLDDEAWGTFFRIVERGGSRHFGSACEAAKRDHVAGQVLARVALSKVHPISPFHWRFTRTALGEPLVCHPPEALDMRFSVSHTRSLVIAAATRACKVGVDAERVEPHVSVEELAPYCLGEMELAHWRQRDGVARILCFYELWTLKESLMKALGVGLTLQPSDIDIVRRSDSSIALEKAPSIAGDLRQWRFYSSQPTSEHVASVALSAPRLGAIRVHWHQPSVEDVLAMFTHWPSET